MKVRGLIVFSLVLSLAVFTFNSASAEDKSAPGGVISKLPKTAGDPELSNGHVYPNWGPPCQRYTYSVVYRDQEGREPEYMKIYFNGQMIDMQPAFDESSAGKPVRIDQLGWAIEKIRKYPMKKHYIISAWNAGCIYEMAPDAKRSMAIAPCHTMFHINITGDKLSLLLYQRSADMFLGVPFNIASYALLTLILAHVTGYKPGDFVHTFGDAHIYENHFDQVKEQVSRTPRPFPTMKLNPRVKDIDSFTYDDFTLSGYDPYPPIKGEITVVGGFVEDKKISNRAKRKI